MKGVILYFISLNMELIRTHKIYLTVQTHPPKGTYKKEVPVRYKNQDKERATWYLTQERPSWMQSYWP